MNNDERIAALLAELIAAARAEFGEPEYTYHKIRYVWTSSRGRKDGYHSTQLGKGPECTQAEFEVNVEQGKRDQVEAVMGRLNKDYYTYKRRLKTDGWPQRLIAMIEAHADEKREQRG